ncbi:hypothetical protein DRN67_04395, partial [Candidatus Micrarchaeota archaeon]
MGGEKKGDELKKGTEFKRSQGQKKGAKAGREDEEKKYQYVRVPLYMFEMFDKSLITLNEAWEAALERFALVDA